MIEQPQLGDLGKLRVKRIARKIGTVVKKAAPIAAIGAGLYFGGQALAASRLRARRKAAPAGAPPQAALPAPEPAGPTAVESIAQGAAAALPAVAQIVAARDAARAVSAGVPPQVLPALDLVQQPRNFAPVTRGAGGELTATFDPVEVSAERPRAGAGGQLPWAWIAAGGGALVLVLLLTQRRD